MSPHVVFNGILLSETMRVSAVQQRADKPIPPETPDEEILKALTRQAEFDITEDPETSVFFETVDLKFEGGKPGYSHHAYVDTTGKLRVDAQLVEDGSVIDGIILQIDHSPGRKK